MPTFTNIWDKRLENALQDAATKNGPYVITCKLQSEDYQAIAAAVNQGIDSRLEACFVPARGDRFHRTASKLECCLSPESLPVLVRRLMEVDNEPANLLAIGICQTLNIELI